ncbi:MAG: 2Fe-2S iron-sulfur cluster binding domain-containing protein [Planctomycetaceae bacterium]|nr:2Fe-2S iron-sulfur cluster-binding protein [Planctomycetaceae bacterium]
MIVLVAGAAVAALSAVLAAVLVLAERFLCNYGRCTIDINSGKRRLEVAGGQTLLAALKEEGIFVPSACGGRGTCSYCKIKITSGGGPVGPTEMPLLTAAEVAANVRISCQVKLRGDAAIEIPPELFSIRQYTGVVERIVDRTYDIKELRIALVDPPTIDFTAGQYIQLEVPAYEGSPEPVYRAYSMSNPPSDNRHVETIIRRVPGGICTTWVFDRLKVGDTVRFNGPHGHFRLSDTSREMVWIAGGSGMAPFWAMVRYMKEHNIRRKCTYFFGAVAKRDLFAVEELKALESELDNFTFVPALSGPAAADNWSGEKGLITDVVDRHVADGSDLEVYLCGSPGMIDAAAGVLAKKNVTKDRMFYDKFA